MVDERTLISVVVPVYNECGSIQALAERLTALVRSDGDRYEYIFVDDGSTDGSGEIIRRLAADNENIKFLALSRNFGHEMATTAGIDHASGDAVIIIDADLQDPPEVIAELIEKWRQGNQIVYAQRRSRKGEGVCKRFASWLFYRIIRLLSSTPIPVDTGDFRLMDSSVVREFRRCRERNRFVRGLVAWTGFKQAAVLYDRDARHAGQTKYNVFKLILLALDAVIGFSTRPLRIGLLLGLPVCLFSACMMIVIIIQKIFFGMTSEGYALLTAGLFFLGGVQLSMIGLIGEYIGRIFTQSQHRPLYILTDKSGSLPRGLEGFYSASAGQTDTSRQNGQSAIR